MTNTRNEMHLESLKCVRGHVTHSRHQQLVDFLHGSLKFELSSILSVFHRDENVKLLVQVLPVWLPSILLLLQGHRQTDRWEVTDRQVNRK